jgi:hypothetical protein
MEKLRDLINTPEIGIFIVLTMLIGIFFLGYKFGGIIGGGISLVIGILTVQFICA